MDKTKCITFNKAAQDALPEHIKAKMKADRGKAKREAYNAISREEEVNRLIEVIEERTGIKVNIIITKLADDEDFQNRFTDIRELVNMDIEVDDKEEYI